METRIKWLFSEVITKETISKLETEFRRKRFTQKNGRGFLLDRVRSDSISGKYIERIEGQRSFLDPFGAAIELPYVTFETIAFSISTKAPQFEFIDPPRSLRKFLLLLSEAIGIEFSISERTVDVLTWADTILARHPSAQLEAISCSDVAITPKTAASVSFVGSERLLQDARTFLGSKHYVVESVRLLSTGQTPQRITISSSAKARIVGSFDQHVSEMLRETLLIG